MGCQKSMHGTQVTDLANSAGTMERRTANPDSVLQKVPRMAPSRCRSACLVPTGRKATRHASNILAYAASMPAPHAQRTVPYRKRSEIRRFCTHRVKELPPTY
jgi:hypothetical protein